MCKSLASLCELVDILGMPDKSNRQAGRDILREQIRIIRIELRSMRRMLANRSKYDPARYALEDHIRAIEKDLRIRQWELARVA